MTLTIPGADVQVGDDLLFLGKPHRVLSLEPYDVQAALGIDAPGTRIARSNDGWAMTVFPSQRCVVERAVTT